ncbi:4-alpha-glucanotransferase [Actinocatenispora rupis]|uniref:4-alpha-glucanotransferase n=1 Tax=Actinocatenispora rupis TaxID=519421 RepID=A0A8J3JI16_9ACTN|nr:4-alpha-glucanotransferase [Actinocatenispora rupis]GID16258.1 4-alpha-glucanotransferase [Actinocatenispora rupis]
MDDALAELADAAGVATAYRDGAGRRVDVSPDVVVAVLGQLDLDAGTPAAVRRSLAEVRARRRRTVAVPAGEEYPVPDGTLRAEDGGERRVTGALPATTPPGWYTLAHRGGETTVLVTPDALPPVPDVWGLAVQAYALHSAGSWGMGDYADLREVVAYGAELGAGALLCNPLCAPDLVPPVPASPYSPTSRRFANPLYLRVTETPEYRRADEATRAKVDALRPDTGELIDYDAVWAAKRAALELLWPLAPRGPVPEPALAGYATFCALADRHGADHRRWPAPLRRPGPAATAAAGPDRVGFHAWLQHRCADQLAAVREAAAPMPVGLLSDLPVGVAAGGADAWAYQDVLAGAVSVGAPPDAFSTAGQDWGLPPWRPDRLDATGYAAYRETLAAACALGGGLRVDHVAGLFRLWWIPPGAPATDGTYVRYDADVLLGALTLAAHRYRVAVVGEDLGTVEPEVTEALRQRHMLGCEVLWFARDDAGSLLPTTAWPRDAVASISTHDLPTAAGFLTGDATRVRARLGLVSPDEAARTEAERDELLTVLRAERLLSVGGETSEAIVALHALLARTPCRIRLAALTDVLGETRAPNLPGTTTGYPNWRIPLPLSVAELRADTRLPRIAALLRTR